MDYCKLLIIKLYPTDFNALNLAMDRERPFLFRFSKLTLSLLVAKVEHLSNPISAMRYDAALKDFMFERELRESGFVEGLVDQISANIETHMRVLQAFFA